MKSSPLNFLIAVVTAIRHEHNIHHPMTHREMAELYQELNDGERVCSWQNIFMIEQRALRKLRVALRWRNKELNRELQERNCKVNFRP
jgi:hypothetical protein